MARGDQATVTLGESRKKQALAFGAMDCAGLLGPRGGEGKGGEGEGMFSWDLRD